MNYIDVVYDEKIRPKTEYPNQLINYLVNRFDIKVGSKVLDCGCGKGYFSEAFEKAGMDVVGVDIDNGGNINISACDFEKDKLPFEDNSFSIIFSKSVLEHIENWGHHLKDVYRVLAPGGKFIVMVPEYDSCQYLFWDDPTHKRPYRLTTVRDVLLMSNFQVICNERFIQLPVVWKYPWLKIICGFLQLFGSPKRISKNKFFRWSRELLICGVGTKSL